MLTIQYCMTALRCAKMTVACSWMSSARIQIQKLEKKHSKSKSPPWHRLELFYQSPRLTVQCATTEIAQP